MRWTKNQTILVSIEALIDLLKIVAIFLILYGVILHEKYDLLGKSLSLVLAILSYSVSQFLKYNRNDVIKKIIAPMVVPIEFATVIPYYLGKNNLKGIIKIKKLFVKEDILILRISVEDDKPFYIHPKVIDHDGKIDFNKPRTGRNILIIPRWTNDNFDIQISNLNLLDISEKQKKEKIRLVVKVLYSSYYNIDKDLFESDDIKLKIKSGEIKEPLVYKNDTKFFEGSLREGKFQIFDREVLKNGINRKLI